MSPELPRVILHIDMDAFFASVEQRDRPELKGFPVVVGAPPDRRGVVCAASYEARAFGIRSAMPSRTAARLCPQAVFLRPRMSVYREESSRIRTILERFGGRIQQVSIDEAYLDWTEVISEGKDPDACVLAAVPQAEAMRQAIHSARGLTASVGLSDTKLLAKLASDFKKPNGFTTVRPSEKRMFLRPLPVSSLHGVGAVTAAALQAAGFARVGDIQDRPGQLPETLGSFADTLRRYALGEDDRPVAEAENSKSISSETTFARDTESRPLLRAVLRQQATEVEARLAAENLAARTVRVKVRYSDFTTLTRQQSFPEPIRDAGEIYRRACHLLRRHQLVRRPLRLIGLGVLGLTEPSGQLELPWPNKPLTNWERSRVEQDRGDGKE
ncbi:MAG: DNA polymerase IV [Candidatus Methylacidiphilales bacterium]